MGLDRVFGSPDSINAVSFGGCLPRTAWLEMDQSALVEDTRGGVDDGFALRIAVDSGSAGDPLVRNAR